MPATGPETHWASAVERLGRWGGRKGHGVVEPWVGAVGQALQRPEGLRAGLGPTLHHQAALRGSSHTGARPVGSTHIHARVLHRDIGDDEVPGAQHLDSFHPDGAAICRARGQSGMHGSCSPKTCPKAGPCHPAPLFSLLGVFPRSQQQQVLSVRCFPTQISGIFWPDGGAGASPAACSLPPPPPPARIAPSD